MCGSLIIVYNKICPLIFNENIFANFIVKHFGEKIANNIYKKKIKIKIVFLQ